MLPRYIFADVDDTFTVGGSLFPGVLSAIDRAQAAGIEVILNTGRPAGYGATLLAYLSSVSAVIVENGGAFFDRSNQAATSPSRDPREVYITYVRPPDPTLRPRLKDLCARVAKRARLSFTETADNPFRLTDHTVLRELPAGQESAAILRELAEHIRIESHGDGSLLASSIHLHFMLDGQGPARSKADGAAALLHRRGIRDVESELKNFAIAVGDSANDVSFFTPGRFALSVGVRNIERYLHELGESRPRHITRAAEGHGMIELVDAILDGSLSGSGVE